MEQEFDTILILDNNLNEGADPRSISTSITNTSYYGDKYLQLDPFLKSPVAFGRAIQRSLNSIGDGYSCSVDDFGGSVVVKMTYTNVATARSASKTFLIRFNGKKGDGMVMSSSAKYRTISGIDQAVSYIRSASSVLVNSTNSQI